MAQTGDILRVVLNQDIRGQLIQNVLHYAFAANDAYSETLIAERLWDILPNALISIQHSELSHTSIDVYNLTDGVSVGSFAGVPKIGLVSAGECLPPFVCWKYVFRRNRTVERNGYLRLAGVPEVAQSIGVVVAAYADEADNIATVLGSVQAFAGIEGLSLTPGTWSTIYGGQVRVPPVFWSRVGRVFFANTTSQNTRKR